MTLVDWIVVMWIMTMGVTAAGMALAARWYMNEANRWRDRYLAERKIRQQEAY